MKHFLSKKFPFKGAYFVITRWTLPGGESVVSTFVTTDTQTSAQVRTEPTPVIRRVEVALFVSWVHPPLTSPLLISVLWQGKRGRQPELMQVQLGGCAAGVWNLRERSHWGGRHRERERERKTCLFKLLPEEANTPALLFSFLSFASFLLTASAMNVTLFYPK